MTPPSDPTPPVDVVARLDVLCTQLLKDRASARKASLLKLALLLCLPVLFALMVHLSFNTTPSGTRTAPLNGEKIAVIKMEGTIGPGDAINADAINPALAKAFRAPQIAVVVLALNSPGGSPVQASLIHDRILALKRTYDKPVIAVAADTLASGGYFIAAAADRIVVNRSTITGSIGVVSQQFGVVDLLTKLGVEARTLTAGESKARLSPFYPVKPSDKAKMEAVLEGIHEHFKEVVREGRKGRLTAPEEFLFSGDFWTGGEAVALGLVDELGDLASVLAELDAEGYTDFTPKKNLLDGVFGGLLQTSAAWLDVKTMAPVVATAEFGK